jgi:hypothetical protein
VWGRRPTGSRRANAFPYLRGGIGTILPSTMPLRSAWGPQNRGRAPRPLGVVINLLKILARPRGVEPLTPRSVVWCSIQLSYGRMPKSE